MIFIVAAEIRRVSAASPSCVYMFCFPSPSHQPLSLQLSCYSHFLKDRTAVAGWMGSVVFKMMTRRNNLNRSLLPGPGLTSEAIKTSYKSQQDSLLLSTVHTLGPDWRGCVIHALHSRLDWAGMATCGRVSGFYKFVCSGEGHLDGDNRMLCKECKL